MHTTFGFNTLRNTQKRYSLHTLARGFCVAERVGRGSEVYFTLGIVMWDVLHSWQPRGMYCTLGSHVHCEKVQSYFGYLSCIPFVYMTRKVQGCLEFEQNVVEKLPSLLN